MRGEGHGQGNVQRLEHGREKSKERRQCCKENNCLPFIRRQIFSLCWASWKTAAEHGSWGNVLALAKLLSQGDNFIFPKLGPRVKLGAAPHLSGHLRITRSQGQTHCPVSPGRVDTPLLTVLVSHGEHRVASRQQEHLGRCGPDITHANSPFNVPIQASKQKAATPHNCSNHSPVMHHLCGGLHAYLAPHR